MCKHCGDKYHKVEDHHFGGKLVKKELDSYEKSHKHKYK